jgi:heme/copper-type cytochrome/quinol oxidase subunit 2
MRVAVVSEPAADFDAWVAEQDEIPPESTGGETIPQQVE